MTDRELLELAAKAVGYTWDAYGISGDGNWWNGSDYLDSWNPLTDDGDALRLAAKIPIEISFFEGSQYVSAEDYHGEHVSTIDYTNDRARDMRLAIVYCAADIGKSMP